MHKKVNFFIVGAPKCGTTALSDYLNQLDDVFIPEIKEPHYHCVEWDDFRRIKTEKEYEGLYNKNFDKLCGDASVWCLFSERSAEEIKRYNDSAKIIIMIRRPYEAAVSLHSQLVYSGREDEKDFVKAWDLQRKRSMGGAVPKNAIIKEHLLYKEVYDYPAQIKRYLDMFGKDGVKIVVFEDFVDKTEKVFGDICDFLGVKIKNRVNYEKVNSNRYHRFPRLAYFMMRPPGPLAWMKAWLKRYILKGKPVLRPLYKKFSVKRERPMISNQDKARISEEFVEIEKETKKIVGSLPW